MRAVRLRYREGAIIIRLAVGFIAFLWAASICAQTTATITGSVSDPSGGLLSAARLRVKSTETGAERVTTTVGNGRFTFSNMPPGTYEIRAEAQGFRPTVRKGVRVGVGDSAEVNFLLKSAPSIRRLRWKPMPFR